MATPGDERQSLTAWLARPFPLWRGAWPEAQLVLLTTLVAATLIYVARPFGLQNVPAADTLVLIAQLSAACALVAILMRVAAPYLAQLYLDESRWTVGLQVARECLEIALLAGVILFIIAANGGARFNAANLALFIGVTTLCAAGPISVRALLLERALRRRHQHTAAALELPPAAALPLRIEAQGEVLTLPAGALRFVRAEENYVSVVWRDGETTRSQLLRATLADMSRQLGAAVAQSHRSYLVALNAIRRVSGNAQGYGVELEGVADPIPVSRARAAAFLDAIRART